jgi:hypothetical protein
MKTEDALAAGATVGAGACATISVSGITSGLAGIGGSIAVGGIAWEHPILEKRENLFAIINRE